ncbi:MAG: two-component system, chemotaxis family, sensor kinase CheA [Sphingomonadales bacterium]|nr:two-component system, chemotaxis family, sensor kinase CheA [Sphingomonadales bacterium]
MDDLINDFIAETREMLEALSGEIVAWEAVPDDRARLDEIFRFVHTVKGNSGFFDLPRIRALSHAAEDALAAVRSGTRSADARLVGSVLAVIDRLAELVEALETGEAMASEDDSALIDALTAVDDSPEAVEADAAPASHAARSSSRTIRLPVELLDRMMSGVSDLVLARNELSRRIRASGDTEMAAAFDRVSATVADLRDAITRTRMQRIDNLFAPLPRMVRDVSGQTGKQVVLEIDGGDVEIDREMLEMIRDPLTHIVRNAIDHGIESPAERKSAGKSETGCLRVCARQAGNQILLEISDDGRGIDGDKLVTRAIAAGLMTAERADRLTSAQKTALVFEPGLSTAAAVTELSGRGVGMDVVRANVERIGGLVEIASRTGRGVVLTLKVPLTLTIIPALTVVADDQVYAIPRSAIEEIVRVKGGSVRVESVGGAAFATVRGRRLPLVHLRAALGREPCADPTTQSLILLRPAGADLYALAVDGIHDHEELVIKPAAPAVMAAGLYAGTTIADDGKPVLLLDPPGIAARAGLSLHRGSDEAAPAPAPAVVSGPPALLFKTLEGRFRLVPVAAVQRIEDVRPETVQLSAGRLHVALGESLLPLVGCGSVVPDRPIRLLRLGDGRSEIAYGFADVVDILPLPSGLMLAAAPGEVRGVVLVGEAQAELLDLHWLFARHAAPAPAATGRPVCAIPAGDPFMDAILRPLVESAGYEVVATGAPGSESASIVIAAENSETAAPSGARLVRIRAEAEGEGDGIHRYDREALLAALAGQAPAKRRRRRG